LDLERSVREIELWRSVGEQSRREVVEAILERSAGEAV